MLWAITPKVLHIFIHCILNGIFFKNIYLASDGITLPNTLCFHSNENFLAKCLFIK